MCALKDYIEAIEHSSKSIVKMIRKGEYDNLTIPYKRFP